jgi:alpha-tubulin suppressor-like RCC1 family protein
VQPNAGPLAGGTKVTITGTGIVTGSTTVAFGANAGTGVQVISATEVRATSPSATSAGTVDVKVTTPGGASTAVAGDKFTYRALTTAMAWGNNEFGQLGNGSTTSSTSPVAVKKLSEVQLVAAGGNQNIGLLKTNVAWGWGRNNSGQVCNGATAERATEPVETKGTEVIAVAGGENFTLMLKKNGTLVACGNNASGQLGNGTTTSSSSPVAVKKLTEITAIAAGASFGVALQANGHVWAWGADSSGQVGNATTTERVTEPVEVSGMSEAHAIAAGATFALAIKNSGKVMAWGLNSSGQLGEGSTTSPRSTPVESKYPSTTVALAGGEKFSLALLSTGRVMAAGANEDGQLGNGSTTASSSPVESKLPEATATAIAAGANHALVLLTGGTLKAWGLNSSGQLGTGSSTGPETCGSSACSKSPVSTKEAGSVTSIAAGGRDSLVN